MRKTLQAPDADRANMADRILHSAGYAKMLERRRALRDAKKAMEVAEDGSVNEQSLALSWNVPRSAMSAVRKSHLREHWHWRIGPSGNQGDIRITREGIEELKKWVVPPEKSVRPEPPPEILANVAPDEIPPADPNIVIVKRVPPNPRMLLCTDPKGDTVSIRLQSNRLFHAGMKIDLAAQCVRLARGSESDCPLYVFKGRLPRAYGRW